MASQNQSDHQLPSQTIPSTAQFIDQLISHLSTFTIPPVDSNHDHRHQPPARHHHRTPLSTLPPSQMAEVKTIMLTLHCIFPNELLLALDILDRNLVNRFICNDTTNTSSSQTSHPTAHHHSSTTNATTKDIHDYFYVRSASTISPDQSDPFSTSTSTSSYHTKEPDPKGYEVRLKAWNCTCPTFTLNAFRDSGPDGSEEEDSSSTTGHDSLSVTKDNHFPFGGSFTRNSTRSSPPVCKHLLACCLAVRCPGLFGGGEGRSVSIVSAEELAGWCAGWGG
ncbi:hypothetical protein BO85DRAFT_401607 [Aspergillus piperis CBS 112811]|uniref:SWIM-type domain-containing protein n=1 Tax=Aspergillus piperis CBS 112811 TaxID=1448313 RepID=A0A8G1QXU3_9EURO|nr:hypothetical protein BO85DRAFT_401607 [Aspergillus piperis CBS 112811]RAH55547.1 hypothetical protein BO85DRAFT_401607 [Aspergillus piperis CBS 112811]